jgi:N-acetylglucosaminyldiphosphoundecaprenol N-acetyl-beta-D-mannosaminyltransferase
MLNKDECIELFNVPISPLTFDQVCDRAAHWIEQREPGFIVTPNVQHVCLCDRMPEFRAAYDHAFLSLADGVPIVWASRLFGAPLPQKLSGSDMVPRLSAFASERGYSVFFLGGTPGTAEKAVEILLARHPSLKIAGMYCPPYGFEKDPAANDATIAAVNAARPDICFVALGSPKQELWMLNNYTRLGVPICVGVGAAFDMLSGRIRRAPEWLQNAGLEWLWRLSQEPRRLWRRYLVEDLVFFKLLWREYTKRRRAAAEAAR